MAKSEPKTKQTKASVADYIAAIEDDTQRADAKTLVRLMKKITGKQPKMWGPSIIGFDTYHYTYASGREGDWPLVGFSPRKGNLSIYIMSGFSGASAMLEKLGKHKTGKSCLYVRRLADIDIDVLEQMIVCSVTHMKKIYPTAG